MRKQRIVMKIGSSSLTNDKGQIDQEKLVDHVQAIATLMENNHEVILVSSGAVAAGFTRLGYPTRPVTLKGKQAAAAVGQSLLIRSYIEEFQKYKIIPAQILLTRNDFVSQHRFRNAYATIMELLERGILPIINENDTVSVEELTFGDNDMLSALVSGFTHADQLILLTDINGLYDSNPRQNPNAKRFDYLDSVSEELLEFAQSGGSKVGTGGMKSKLLAAKTATSLGVPVFIGLGKGRNKLIDILQGVGDGTYISSPTTNTINVNRQWIALHSQTSGKLFVDAGAEEAIIHNGKSLLSAGVYKIQGTFQEGDVVEVFGINGLLGKGVVNLSSDQVENEIQNRYDNKATTETPLSSLLIHRDRWVQVVKEEE